MRKIVLLLYLIAFASVILANIPKILETLDRLFPTGYIPKNYRSDW